MIMDQEKSEVPDVGNPACKPQEQELSPSEKQAALSGATPTASPSENRGDKFTPYETNRWPEIPSGLSPDRWILVQCAPANFQPSHFLSVCRNLLENPNLTASHLARAELSYASFTDATFNPEAKTPEELASIIKHLRPECRPRLPQDVLEEYRLDYTVVRKLVPRNPKLDDSLMQTCHLYVSEQDIKISVGAVGEDGAKREETAKAERYMVVYIPHVDDDANGHGADAIPYYHPKVRALVILYTYFPDGLGAAPTLDSSGLLSIYYDLFPYLPLDNRLERTALKLAEIIHKHARGRQAGYRKRVHHDQIIGQKRFQDTYAYLKGKYAKDLINGWVEQTPPEKHVFEDLGIAAFLEELWVDMYGDIANREETNDTSVEAAHKEDDGRYKAEHRKKVAQSKFPGFVDVGCGNGLLVSILNTQGWSGWGFDARHRKTWDTFPTSHTQKLKEMLLVPAIITQQSSSTSAMPTTPQHNGIFPPKTFIISNHADELTPWTPLLAYLNDSPFIAIPCCSHDLGGTRFRAPPHSKHLISDPATAAAKNKDKPPSAYASLCSWVCHLAEETGFKVEREHLRIPSTRNVAVLGRTRVVQEDGDGDRDGQTDQKGMEEKLGFLRNLVEKEMGGMSVEQVGDMWMKSGDGLVKPGKGGH
ncbi:tRNA (uracil-O(2)-)-methyltransferase [Curvularia clavata]|uniref:tRNA (uracil-O(2)-)-methyltransferase n=1 Tax=Curvularia clavata TaxID=95742 RepID=A0A9Q8ZD72_CURCL|nr:tRNA (uracil-O(2)-)-methyltransferase [Curvularia clavata]